MLKAIYMAGSRLRGIIIKLLQELIAPKRIKNSTFTKLSDSYLKAVNLRNNYYM